ncbi:peptidoglycan-binding protein [Streptomyces sp. RFCAC02]|uniref:peptidoglycan-binding protein n=1 Tax=Streptomyces sp. RFCAC02 TaxID=2499143 RepID=UPI00101FC619|nr:peptidoglycan-binding protein [Streptomyces sp. RFCAC02]
MTRARAGRRIALATAVLVAAGGVFLALDRARGGGTEAAADALPSETAEVTRQTLVDVTTADGLLGHGPATTVGSRLAGTVTALPAADAEIGRGEALFEVDGRPVVLLYGGTPAYRDLAVGTTGPDVAQLEENLDELGYTGFTVDDEFTDATAVAVREWQEDLGLPLTGTLELGRVAFLSGPVRVDSLEAATGDPVTPDAAVLAVTGTGRAVTVELDVSDQRLVAEGVEVGVRLPDDSVQPGTVTAVTMEIRAGEDGQDMRTVIEAVVGLDGDEAQEAAADWARAAVHVEFTAGEREDVLTVPVAALLALADGGFGVEVVEGETTRYVPVDAGLFSDGRVEISGDGITEGMTVGMPA